jgi:two-component system alkaline phosphatase synthesis response regulator PhoP
MEHHTRILIVEDDMDIARLITIALRQAGFITEHASDGHQGADLVEQNNYDLVLLDIMLPCISGYELLPYIAQYEIPVIFITAKGELDDKLRGFRMGADDYLVKPFELEELLVRVENVLRHYGKAQTVLRLWGVTIDTTAHSVTCGDTVVSLTPKEYALLVYLVRNRGRALHRFALLEKVWGADFPGDTRTLDIHIRRLRQKLCWEEKIGTIPKFGYRLEAE